MAKSKKKPESPFVGRWHIESMTEWDEDFINAEVRGFLSFDARAAASASLATSTAGWTAG